MNSQEGGALVGGEELVVGEVFRDLVGHSQEHFRCGGVDDGLDHLDELLVVSVDGLVHGFAEHGVVAEQVAQVDVVVGEGDVHVQLVELEVPLAVAGLDVALEGGLAVRVSGVAGHGPAGLDGQRQHVHVHFVLAVEPDVGDLDAGAVRVRVQVDFDLVDLEVADAAGVHVVAHCLEPGQARVLHGGDVDLAQVQRLHGGHLQLGDAGLELRPQALDRVLDAVGDLGVILLAHLDVGR